MSVAVTKAELRKTAIRARQALPVEEWRSRSDRLCQHLQTYSLFIQAQTVLAYFSFRQEPDLSPLFSHPKVWGFPRCVGKSLHWHRWSPQDALPLQSGAYGILEPHPDAPPIAPEQVDVLLVPAVACDHQGFRLGYGGGFYDRLFSDPLWASKPTIGIVFDQARLPYLPRDPWDHRLTAVCTESGMWMSGDMGLTDGKGDSQNAPDDKTCLSEIQSPD